MSAITVNLPDGLYKTAREVAVAKNLSMDALVAIALSQSLSRLVPDVSLEERASRATGAGIKAFLGQAPNAEPPDWDSLPEGYKSKG